MKTISMWKNVGWFTPPTPRNRQGRFTPQIVCTIYPPKNHQGRFTPQIVCMIYPPKIAFISTFLPPKSDIN